MTNKIAFGEVAKYDSNNRLVGHLAIYGESVPIVTRPIMRQYTLWSSVTSVRFWRKDD